MGWASIDQAGEQGYRSYRRLDDCVVLIRYSGETKYNTENATAGDGYCHSLPDILDQLACQRRRPEGDRDKIDFTDAAFIHGLAPELVNVHFLFFSGGYVNEYPLHGKFGPMNCES